MKAIIKATLIVLSITTLWGNFTFAQNEDCTYTPSPSSWQAPYDDFTYRLSMGQTSVSTWAGHIQVVQTALRTYNDGSYKLFIDGQAVNLYGDAELTQRVGTNFDYSANSKTVEFWFWPNFRQNAEIQLKHWEGYAGEVYVNWNMNVQCAPSSQAPSVTIGIPHSGTSTKASYVGLAGVSADPDGIVEAVQIRVNGGSWFNAAGTTSWEAVATLALGRNTIEVRALDDDGLYSSVQSIAVTREQKEPPFSSIDRIEPERLRRGDTNITMMIYGNDFSNQVDGFPKVYLGAGVEVERVTMDSDSQLTVQISKIYADTPLGARDILVKNSESRENLWRNALEIIDIPTLHKPTVAITGAEQITTASNVDLEGTAVDPDGSISRVEMRVNGGAWLPLIGTETWGFTAALEVGDNIIDVRARDNDGLYSDVQSVKITRNNVITQQDAATLLQETYPAHTSVPENTIFTKSWTIENTGNTTWDGAYRLRYVNGVLNTNQVEIALEGNVMPGESYQFQVPMKAPAAQSSARSYQEAWEFINASGQTIPIGTSPILTAVIAVPAIIAPEPQPAAGDWIPPSDGFYYPVFGQYKNRSDWDISADFRDTKYPNEENPFPNHPGEDWNLGSGSFDLDAPVYAVANGQVVDIKSNESGGWLGTSVLIKHFHQGQLYWSQYSHLQAVTLVKGQWVQRGQKIGNIGPYPKGPHLHFEIRKTDLGIQKWPATHQQPEAMGFLNPTEESSSDGTHTTLPGFIDNNETNSVSLTALMDSYIAKDVILQEIRRAASLPGAPIERLNQNHIESRAAFVEILVSALEKLAGRTLSARSSSSFPFTDVPSSAWFYESVMKAWNLGVLSIPTDGRFRPDDPILRIEVLTLLVKTYEHYKGYIVSQAVDAFADVLPGNVAVWAYESAQKGYTARLTNGYIENGTRYFRPERWTPRGEAVAFVDKLIQSIKELPNLERQIEYEALNRIQLDETIQHIISLRAYNGPVKIRVAWPGSDLDLRITIPSGEVLTPDSHSVLDFFEGATEDYYLIDSEEEGEWSIEVIGVEVDPEGEPYELKVTVGEKRKEAKLTGFNFVVPGFSISNEDNDGFSEILRFEAGVVSPVTDSIFIDAGCETVKFADLLLDPSSYISGSVYDFAQTTYTDGFSLYDDDGSFLLGADLMVSSLVVNGGTGAVNPEFTVNLTNFETAPEYIPGTSEIIDAFLSAGAGALNLTLQFAGGNLGREIEYGKDVLGTVSGSTASNPVPEPSTLILLGCGVLGILTSVRKRYNSKK